MSSKPSNSTPHYGEAVPFDSSQSAIFDQPSMQYANSKFLRLVTDIFISDVKSGKISIDKFYKELYKMSSLDAKSLLYTANILTNKSSENINLDDDDYLNQLIMHLRSQPNSLLAYNQLILFKIDNNLPDDYINWVRKELRHALFIINLIYDDIKFKTFYGGDELIAYISDFLRYNIELFNSLSPKNMPRFENHLTYYDDQRVVGITWAKSMYFKNRTSQRDLKWIDSSNDDQINYLYDYLNDNHDEYLILKDIFIPEKIREKYDLICASFDSLSNITDSNFKIKKKFSSHRSYIIFKAKNAWNSYVQYANKHPKDKNLMVKIYYKNQDKLRDLAKHSGLTINELVNKSLENTFDDILN